jgi:hypothetical protein
MRCAMPVERWLIEQIEALRKGPRTKRKRPAESRFDGNADNPNYVPLNRRGR